MSFNKLLFGLSRAASLILDKMRSLPFPALRRPEKLLEKISSCLFRPTDDTNLVNLYLENLESNYHYDLVLSSW